METKLPPTFGQIFSEFRAFPHISTNLLLSFIILIIFTQNPVKPNLFPIQKLSVGQPTIMELPNFYQDFLIEYAFYRGWTSARLILPSENHSALICDQLSVPLILSKASLNINCSLESDPETYSGESGVEPIIIFDFIDHNLTSALSNLLKNYSSHHPLLFLTQNMSLDQVPSMTHGNNRKWTLVSFDRNETGLEIYNIYGFATSSVPITRWIGSWAPATGLELDMSKDFGLTSFEERSLRITTVGGAPFVIVETQNGSLTASGYLPDLFKLVKLILNFSVILLTPPDGKFGDQDESGNWSGMVGMLIRNEADAALMSFSYTRGRRAVMDFSPPVEYSTTRLLIRRDQRASGVKWSAFFRPFNLNVWMTLLLLIGLGSASLTIFAKLNLFQASSAEVVWLLSTCFVNQGQSERSTVVRTPFRIVVGCFLLLAVFVFACYTARLTSFLAADNDDLPVDDMSEAVTSSSWKVGVVKGSPVIDKVRESDSKEMQLLWQKIQKDPSVLVSGSAEGIERVHRESYIFFASELAPTYLIKDNCSFAWIPGNYFPGFGYMGYQKGLPYGGSISRALQKIREVGLIKRTFQLWWGTQAACGGGGADSFPAVSLHEVGSAFVVLAVGFIMACLFSTMEFFKDRTELKSKFQ